MFIAEIAYNNAPTIFVGPFPTGDAAEDYIDALLIEQPDIDACLASYPVQFPDK